jgi:hypothetical protein
MPKDYFDRLSMLEVSAAVAAAGADYARASKLQNDAIREASHYDLPTDALQAELDAYAAGRAWTDRTLAIEP